MNVLDAGETGIVAPGALTESFALISSKAASSAAAFEPAAADPTDPAASFVCADAVETGPSAAGICALADAVTGIAGDAAVAGAPGLAGSLLRNSPRATRNVPL